MFENKKGFTVIKASIAIAIIAVLVVLVGVWYVSKNRAGADVGKPGIITGTIGITPGGGVDPGKMGMGTVKGQVTDKNGKPASATVSIQSGKCAVSQGLFESAYTDSKGYFSKTNIPPGSYCVWADGLGYGSARKDIGVKKGGITTINLKTNLKYPRI